MPSRDEIREALEAAGESHHEFEVTYLKGVRDELWSGYYAAYTLGRLPELDITPSRLATLLEQAEGENWSAAAATLVAATIEDN